MYQGQLDTKVVQKVLGLNSEESESLKCLGKKNQPFQRSWYLVLKTACLSPRSQLKMFNYDSAFWVRLRTFWMNQVFKPRHYDQQEEIRQPGIDLPTVLFWPERLCSCVTLFKVAWHMYWGFTPFPGINRKGHRHAANEGMDSYR